MIANRETTKSTTRRAFTTPLLIVAASLVAACSDDVADAVSDVTDDVDSLQGDAASFTRIYQSSEFQTCSSCHAPGAVGRTVGIEATQDWSTRDKAYATLQGDASGLIGNFADCNGVPLIGASADQSLLVAAFDEDVRRDFRSPEVPACDGDAISDQTLKLGGPLPALLLSNLKAWVDAGAPDR